MGRFVWRRELSLLSRFAPSSGIANTVLTGTGFSLLSILLSSYYHLKTLRYSFLMLLVLLTFVLHHSYLGPGGVSGFPMSLQVAIPFLITLSDRGSVFERLPQQCYTIRVIEEEFFLFLLSQHRGIIGAHQCKKLDKFWHVAATSCEPT